MSAPTSTTPAERVNHITAKPSDELSWRPPQRTARLAVSAALVVTIFYMIFLFNPAYRGVTWLWALVVCAEGLVVVQALLTWWTVLANDHRPDKPEVYAWRRKLAHGELTPSVDVFITVLRRTEGDRARHRARGAGHAGGAQHLDPRRRRQRRDPRPRGRRGRRLSPPNDPRSRQGGQRQRRLLGHRGRVHGRSSTPTTSPAPTSCCAPCRTCRTRTSRSCRRRRRSRRPAIWSPSAPPKRSASSTSL